MAGLPKVCEPLVTCRLKPRLFVWLPSMQLFIACGTGTIVVQAAQGDTFADVLSRVARRRPWLVHDDAAVTLADRAVLLRVHGLLVSV